MNIYKLLFFLVVTAISDKSVLAQDFYHLDSIQKIEIYFSQPDWDYQMDTSKSGADDFIMADWIKINGIRFDSVGVKYKGNSSYDSTYQKNPIHIELDTYKSQSYLGYKDIKLGNGYADPSMIREVLSYEILSSYMICPKANFARVYVNGNYIGLYSNVESITKSYCADKFNISKNTMIKCNPIINPGPNTKSNLRFITGGDSSAYFNYYEIKSKYGWNDLKALSDSVTNHASNIESIMDVDRLIWMLAFNNILVNLDSYSGVFSQNYYLYKDNNGRFNPIVWDLNMSLGGFPFLGSSNNSMGSLTVANMQQMPLSIHSSDSYWPLIQAVWNNDKYRRMYIAHAKTILQEYFENSKYDSLAKHCQALIDSAVANDTHQFFTYSQFNNAMTANTGVGSYQVPGISTLMDTRVTYLKSTQEYLYISPTISNLKQTPGFVGSVTYISINAINADNIYIGYRFSAIQKFSKMPMLDDGAHNDGAAGDGVYGASIYMQDAEMQYYIYGENSNAATFFPARAEYEFLTIKAANGIIANDISDDWQVYPNPANTEINIVSLRFSNIYKLELTNVLGEKMREINISNPKANQSISMDVSNISNGFYWVKLYNSECELLKIVSFVKNQ